MHIRTIPLQTLVQTPLKFAKTMKKTLKSRDHNILYQNVQVTGGKQSLPPPLNGGLGLPAMSGIGYAVSTPETYFGFLIRTWLLVISARKEEEQTVVHIQGWHIRRGPRPP